MKECIKCKKSKALSEFYKHKQMKDGHLSKCTECCKFDAKKNRELNIDRIREYDRKRGNRQSKEYLSEYRLRYPNKYKAQRMVAKAIKSKKLFKEPCVVCGDANTVAHHNDYLKPLNVTWMCQAHHKQWHTKNGEGLNG